MDERGASDDAARQTAALMGFIVILLLAIIPVMAINIRRFRAQEAIR